MRSARLSRRFGFLDRVLMLSSWAPVPTDVRHLYIGNRLYAPLLCLGRCSDHLGVSLLRFTPRPLLSGLGCTCLGPRPFSKRHRPRPGRVCLQHFVGRCLRSVFGPRAGRCLAAPWHLMLRCLVTSFVASLLHFSWAVASSSSSAPVPADARRHVANACASRCSSASGGAPLWPLPLSRAHLSRVYPGVD